ncbi:MAG: efflux RND transporter periplasmic adaptor subunit [Emcibacter sp.]|nr:efflux RND transporter periplasmic adaptor subunit [Emcibacter sp.]
MNKNTTIIAFIALILGVFLGFILFNNPQRSVQKPEDEKKIAYWVAPMDSNYRRDTPGKSPMGMDLIPVYEDNNSEIRHDVGFTIPSHIQANLGLKVAPVTEEIFIPLIEATGRLAYDETRIFRLQVRAEGWVEKLFIQAIGENVKRGDKLFALYSPDIATALGEYKETLRGSSKIRQKASKNRLISLGLSEQSINEALTDGDFTHAIIFYAPEDGVVTNLGVREGSNLVKNTIAFEITDPSNLWLIADVFETDAFGLNQNASAEIIGQDGLIQMAKIDHIYPELDHLSRTIKVRFNISNPAQKLRPGQFFTVNIKENPAHSLTIPENAVIRLGSGNHVIIAHDKNRFEAAEIKLGKSAKGRIQVLKGLSIGEKIVTSGQFMLDSESSFTGEKLRLLETHHD